MKTTVISRNDDNCYLQGSRLLSQGRNLTVICRDEDDWYPEKWRRLLSPGLKMTVNSRNEDNGYTQHPVTWIQRKSHHFGQSAHVDWGKIEQDPAGLVLTLKTWALYSVRCPGRRPSILMSHSHRHRNKKEGGWIYILSRSIKQWIVNNLFHAIKIKIACCLVSWVILCDNERYVMCSN